MKNSYNSIAKQQTTQLKMSKGLKQRFLQRSYTNDQHEKCSNIFNHYRNTNEKYSEILPYTSQNGHHKQTNKKKLKIINARKDVENYSWWVLNWCSHYEKSYGGFLKN